MIMNELLQVLKKVNPRIDFMNSKRLVTDKVLDSIDMTSLLAELEGTFNIEIEMEDITPENFDSVEAIWNLIQELKE